MERAARISRAHALALPRSRSAATNEWIVAGIALALLLAGLLVP